MRFGIGARIGSLRSIMSQAKAAVEAGADGTAQRITSPLDTLLRPRSIAIVGAVAREGSFGLRLLNAITSGHYRGAMYRINPRYGSTFRRHLAVPRTSRSHYEIGLSSGHLTVPAINAHAAGQYCTRAAGVGPRFDSMGRRPAPTEIQWVRSLQGPGRGNARAVDGSTHPLIETQNGRQISAGSGLAAGLSAN